MKRPPLHPNCRCTVIPYVDMGAELEGERPAAATDFDALAEEAYNKIAKEKGWKRRYKDLSPSTRLKYYYEAQKRYEKETGKPAYTRVKGNTTFQDYFENQPESFKRQWLGPKRYDLYSQGKYDPLTLGNPDTGYVVPVEKLAPNEPKPEPKPKPEPEKNPTPKPTPKPKPEESQVNEQWQKLKDVASGKTPSTFQLIDGRGSVKKPEPKKPKKPSVPWATIESLYDQTQYAFEDMQAGKEKLAPGAEEKVKRLISLLPDIELYMEDDDYSEADEVYYGVENLKEVYEEWKQKTQAEPEHITPEPESAPVQTEPREQPRSGEGRNATPEKVVTRKSGDWWTPVSEAIRAAERQIARLEKGEIFALDESILKACFDLEPFLREKVSGGDRGETVSIESSLITM